MNIFQNAPIQTIGKILGTLVLTAVVVGTGLALFKVVGPIPLSVSQTTTQKMSSFDVTGESELTVIPDEARVSVGIEANANTVAAAQDQANKVMNDVIEALKKMDIKDEDIRTQNYSVNPQYEYLPNVKPRINGYQVSTNLRVTVRDFSKLNEVIDTATKLGANNIGGIEFTMSEEKEEDLVKEAREEAIKDAQESAQELASLAGVKLGKVINVFENPQYKQMPVFYGEARMALDAAGNAEPTQVQPGSQKFNYSVTLSYETL